VIQKTSAKQFLKKTAISSFILVLLFLVLGIIEIYNDILFELFHLKIFSFPLLANLIPILFMFLLKSLQYAGLFVLLLFSFTLVREMNIFKRMQHDQDAMEKFYNNVTTFINDAIIPAVIIYLVLFIYNFGPLTLTYYFYFLSGIIPEFVKNLISYNAINLVTKLFLSVLIAVHFCRFRISQYSSKYIFFLSCFIIIAVVPSLVFLLHHFLAWHSKLFICLSIALLLFISGLFLIKCGYRLSRGFAIFVILGGLANIYVYSVTRNSAYNVIHMVLDTLRMESFNEKSMPFLWSLKDKGIYFPNSYSSSDNTITTHNAMLYGKYAAKIGFEAGPYNVPTLMDILKKYQYHTTVVSSNGRLCIVNGYDKGVDDFYEAWKIKNHVRNVQLITDSYIPEKFKTIQKFYNFFQDSVINKARPIDKNPFGHRVYKHYNYEPASVVNEFVKSVIEDNPVSQPLYLLINYLDPHAPYLAPEEMQLTRVKQQLETTFPDIYKKLDFANVSVSDTTIFRRFMLMWNEVDSCKDKNSKDAFLKFCYEENLRYLDKELAKLFDYCNNRHLFANTLFIITSDHGESFGEHSLYRHGNKRLYNQEIKVPLMMLLPDTYGLKIENRIVTATTQSIDLYPTIMDLLGIKATAELDGRSLLPFVFDDSLDADTGYAIAEYAGVSAITDNRAKLIVRDNGIEFYDLVSDPNEENNVAAVKPDVVKMYLAELQKTTNSNRMNTKQVKTERQRRHNYDPETLRQLKTLGYIK
jgi:arylsulfatase A-like enzyme